MTNHIHLQLETIDIEIWTIMRHINLSYSKYFNNKYNFIGHLFQGRYKSEVIESDKYNLETSRYIHLNPVRASMVATHVEYKWSSYDVYMGERENKILSDKKILSYFKNNSRELYRNHVEAKLLIEGMGEEIMKEVGVE